MADLEERVQRLEAIEGIRRLKIRYAQLCDANYDPPGLTALFTEDAVWDGGDLGRYEGHDQIRGFWEAASKSFTFALHYMIGHTIDVDPPFTSGTGHWYIWEPATVNGRAVFLGATYDDVYQKVGDDWRFKQVNANLHFFTPYEDGWVKTPMMPMD